MNRPRGFGSTIQSRADFCPWCDSREIVKRGLRRNTYRHLQIYWCKDCTKHFLALSGLKGVKYPPRIIARALCLFHLGYSQEEVAQRLQRDHRITVPRRTISHWVTGYQSITTFSRLRSAARLAFGSQMLRERMLNHQQAYQYKIHMPKLVRLGHLISVEAATNIEEYLLGVLGEYPDYLFQEDDAFEFGGTAPGVMRSSQSRFQTLPVMRFEKQNLATHVF